MQLGVSDGFKFGCGVILATLACSFLLIIIGTLVLLIATNVFNVPVPLLPPRG